MLVITKLKNFFNEFHENINRNYEKPYYENLIRQQRAPKEIENYINREDKLFLNPKRNKTKKAIQELIKRIEKTTTIEEAKTILEDFNFTLSENKTKKSYIT